MIGQMSKTLLRFGLFVVSIGFFLPVLTYAQGLTPDTHVMQKAKVLSIITEGKSLVAGTDTMTEHQTIKAEILDGPEEGKVLTVENDYLNLKVGQVFFLQHTTSAYDGQDYYAVSDPYRLGALFWLVVLFVVVVAVIGGWQGIRGLGSLVISLVFIFYVLFPGILHGYSPMLISIGVSSLIIILGSYITHGFNKTTSAAVFGMVAAIGVTGALALVVVHLTQLSGLGTEEAVYLNFNTHGTIDFVGLLLGGMLIGLLGVLYDAAISQAISVEELHHVGPHLSRRFIFTRAMRIGREHIGALVNTLAIAYVGVSLPLLLFIYTASDAPLLTVNRELFATEIVRTMIGSIGLVLAVPLTTAVAVLMLVHPVQTADTALVRRERESAEHLEHHH